MKNFRKTGPMVAAALGMALSVGAVQAADVEWKASH